MTRPLLFVLYALYAIALSAVLARAGHRSRVVASGGAPRKRPTRVLIVGATGGTGRQLVAQALERGFAVTALVRNPSKLRVDHPQLTVIQGDVLDYASVEVAIRGQEAVVSALGHKRFFYPTRILSEGTRNILRAMDTHAVPRLFAKPPRHRRRAGRLGLLLTLFTIPGLAFLFGTRRQARMIAAARWSGVVRPGADQRDSDERLAWSHVGGLLAVRIPVLTLRTLC